MRRSVLFVFGLFGSLAGCQTAQQTAEAEAMLTCTQSGYGPGTRYHEYCVSKIKPAALAASQRRALDDMSTGLEQISRGLNPPTPQPKLSCIRTGNVTNCY